MYFLSSFNSGDPWVERDAAEYAKNLHRSAKVQAVAKNTLKATKKGPGFQRFSNE